MGKIQNVGDWLDKAPWRGRAVSLIFISADGSLRVQEHTLEGKRHLLSVTEPGVLLVAWHGTWRTDVRIIAGGNLRALVSAALT